MTRARASAWAAAALLLVAGGGVWWATRPAPPPAELPEGVKPSAPAPAADAARVWSADTIAEFVPVPPAHRDAVGRPIPAMPEFDAAMETLGRVVERWDADPDNAWAVAHGLLARGTELRLTTGLPAVDHLFAVYAEVHEVGGRRLPSFPRERDGRPVEPHTDLILKNLTEIGASPDAAYPLGDGTVTLADLYRYTLLRTFLRPKENKSSFQDPNDMAWGVQALAAWAPPHLRWTALDGTAMDMDALAHFLLVVATKESKFMFDAARAGQKFERTGQPLFGYTCGGAHLVQGATYAVARGFGEPEDRKYATAQGPLLLYRLPIELGIYDEAMKKSREHRERLLVQRMKFLGHWLETMSKLQILGLFTPDEVQMHSVEGAAQNLALTVDALQKLGTFDRLEKLREEDHQLFLDVIGDAGHAIRGLELALGRQTLAW